MAVNKDSWRRSGRSCYQWQADLLGRCWVRLHCNGGFKGWCTTLNPWPFCVMSAPSWFVRWFTRRAFGGVKLSKLFFSYVYLYDIFSSIITPKGKSPNFWTTNFFNHNFGNNSHDGINYCTNLAYPITLSSILVVLQIINQMILKGIRTALQTTTSFRPFYFGLIRLIWPKMPTLSGTQGALGRQVHKE